MKLQYDIKVISTPFTAQEKKELEQVIESNGKELTLRQLENQFKDYILESFENDGIVEVKASFIEGENK